MPTREPKSVEEISAGFLSQLASKALGRPVEVTGFELIHDPFEFPRFGAKEFYEIKFSHESAGGPGSASIILRVMPEMDAVMMLTGDTEHRELKAFKTGLFNQVPGVFHVPYLYAIDEPGQYWAFLQDVRPQMQALGMHAKCPEPIVRQILSHLAVFHAAFWEKREVIDQPWLMSLRRPVDYFYRTITDALDGMKNAADSSLYIVEQWPWLAEGAVNLLNSLPPDTRRIIERLYREPEPLVEQVEKMPMTLCHYDFDNRNLGLGDSQTVVIDWEILGKGISASDVVRFMVYQQPENLDELITHYLDRLEEALGHPIDREEWRRGYDLATIAEWQIRGVLFGVMVAAPSAPVPDDQREAMKERVFGDIGLVESLARKSGLA